MLTKNDMARVVVQALYNKDTLPAADNLNVLTMAKTHNKEWFLEWHSKAIKILQDKIT